ncbi:AAA-ATPase At2g46620-like [Quercus lobata]|uniref:AAA-ATPase At2g46620-like n=1 Tax=Quercus lobata TaxID=97700 RepID=UPI001245753E|nr:AAA-ATPase At2g46620-like [Quercus lobata]
MYEHRSAFHMYSSGKVPLGLKRKGLRVVVTGEAGFVGYHLVDRLMERGDSVIVVDNFFTGRKENQGNRRWRSVPFTHPLTFENISMEEDLKNKVKFDLESFLKGKQYYHRLGRVWRHNFLLYSPSGTGKSSFVAAMANFLSYDVYDINVSKVSKDSDLNSLLLGTMSRSIIVIKDFDRFLMEKPRTKNLSMIMKFMDGILNSCITEERLMVFTMNSKEYLLIDTTILRSGQIDVHIHFPLCKFL